MEFLELKKIIFEIKNLLTRLNNKMGITEERVNDLDIRPVESIQSEEQRGKKIEKKRTEPQRLKKHYQNV